MFSFDGRCHGERGSQKNTGIPVVNGQYVVLGGGQVKVLAAGHFGGDRCFQLIGSSCPVEVDDHRVPGDPLNQRSNGRPVELSDNQISFPITGLGSVSGPCLSLAHRAHRRHETLLSLTNNTPPAALQSTRTQGLLPAERDKGL